MSVMWVENQSKNIVFLKPEGCCVITRWNSHGNSLHMLSIFTVLFCVESSRALNLTFWLREILTTSALERSTYMYMYVCRVAVIFQIQYLYTCRDILYLEGPLYTDRSRPKTVMLTLFSSYAVFYTWAHDHT